MNNKRTLRQADMADRVAVEALVHAAYTPWVDLIGAVPGPMRDDYAALIAKGQVTVLEVADRIEAIMVLIPKDDVLLLDNVATLPEAQGKGLSLHLMNMAEARALDMGYDIIRLYTHARMEANIRLYLRRGYKRAFERTENGLPRVYMEKRLGLYDF